MWINKLIAIIILIIVSIPNLAQSQDWSNWKYFYGISWGEPVANFDRTCRYAKAMGYKGVVLPNGITTAQVNAVANRSNLTFYLMDPDQNRYMFQHAGGTYTTTGRSIHTDIAYSQNEIDFYESKMAWGTNTTWPNNIARGYYSLVSGTTTQFAALWDYQQQAVITDSIDRLITVINLYKNDAIGFSFGGIVYDVPRIEGAWHYWNGSVNVDTDISSSTGTLSCLLHGSITHEYATYKDGLVAYYGQLMDTLRNTYGTDNVHWISEPAYIWKNTILDPHKDEWVFQGSSHTSYADLRQDLYIIEGNALDRFITEPNIFNNTQIPITYSMVGSAEAVLTEESAIRTLVVSIGTYGVYYNWSPQLPNTAYSSIVNVPPRIQLIHSITNWDNLAQMGTPTRSAGNEYGTISYRCEYPDGYPRSIINNRVMYSRPDWDVNKIYVAVGTTTGTITINSATRGLIRAKYVNEYFEPIATSSALADIELSGDTISWKSNASIESGSWTGYILEIGTKGVSVCTY